ncbi:MAG: hypothetical protein ACRD2T_16515, partial [Thermoanaerobaculia bacterium]
MTPRPEERPGSRPPPASTVEPALPPALAAAALLALSFSTALFTLMLARLLGLFIVPSLCFALLALGLPAGACLGARRCGASARSFRGSLWGLRAVMVLSTAACLAARRFDHLRARLFEAELAGLLGQIAALSGLFIPWFAAMGLGEYVGFRFGRERLRGGDAPGLRAPPLRVGGRLPVPPARPGGG